MSEFANPAVGAPDQAHAYTTAILGILGQRDPFDVLRKTPAELRSAASGVPPALLSTPEKPGKWSMLQVVQHLADTEMVGGFRWRMILAEDRPKLQGFDQDLWAERLRYAESDLATALGQFEALRRANLAVLERTSPRERERIGLHSERGEESVAHMIRMYAGHDLAHLRQIARVRRAVTGS
ncbi:MAG: DinB family protein [Candidatus Eiseniibacteriota bacterium]